MLVGALMPRDSLGDFEHQVLLAILRLGGEAYSVPIVLELEERTGREIAQAAVFIVLRRLESKGLLDSRLENGAASKTGRTRRYFALTPPAIERLRESRRALVRLWEGVEGRLDEG
jgi:DNA-binding PadR family transcriptional regulator